MNNVVYLKIKQVESEKAKQKTIRQLAQQVQFLIKSSSQLNFASLLGKPLEPNKAFLERFVMNYLEEHSGEQVTAEKIARTLWRNLEDAEQNRWHERG